MIYYKRWWYSWLPSSTDCAAFVVVTFVGRCCNIYYLDYDRYPVFTLSWTFIYSKYRL